MSLIVDIRVITGEDPFDIEGDGKSSGKTRTALACFSSQGNIGSGRSMEGGVEGT